MDERVQQLLRDIEGAEQDELHYEAAQPLMQLCAGQQLSLQAVAARYPALARLFALDEDALVEYELMLALRNDEVGGGLIRPKSIPNPPPHGKPKSTRRRFLALPLTATATRGSAQAAATVWRAASIHAEVALRTVTTDEGRWQVEGYVTSKGTPVAGAPVYLSTTEATHSTVSDAGGFFELSDVVDGTWMLSVQLADGTLVVEDIVLLDE